MKVAVVGAGSWGTAIASVISANGPVGLWAKRPELAAAMHESRHNVDYLPSLRIPEAVAVTGALAEALDGAGLVLVAVPSHGFRAVLEQAAPALDEETPVISLAKGIEEESLNRMTEVATEVLHGHSANTVGVLTGPNLATEIAAGQPAASVLAMSREEDAAALQPALMTPRFRVYTNPDVVGCEIAGATKNVMAIAAGASAGLGYGTNASAALVTRALAEVTRLGVALGGSPLTFAGLAGIGDLIVTCMSEVSRNHRVGYELGRGARLAEILERSRMVAEGVRTTRSVLALAEHAGVEMPIAVRVGAVLYEGRDPAEMMPELMGREAKSELYGFS